MLARRIAIVLAAALAACGAKQSPPRAVANAPIAVTGPKREERVEPVAPSAELPHSQVAAALTADVVLSTIKDRYLTGVERCYQRHSKSHGAANARVLVSFTVDETGKTRNGLARGIARRVDGCITAQVARWQFPAPKAESSFALGLQLATD